MKKIMLASVIMLMLGITSVFAGVKEGDAFKAEKKYPEALQQYEDVLKDATVYAYQKGWARVWIGTVYRLQKNYSKAIEQYESIVADTSVYVDTRGVAQYFISQTYREEKKYPEAIISYKKVLSLEGLNNNDIKGYVQYDIGETYREEGKIEEAQLAFVKNCSMRNLPLVRYENAYKEIDKVALGVVKYQELLSKMILVIPATPENASFLSLLRSEQEKLK